ncbi:MAG: reactive intermediate/imine deaminase [Flavobacteriaceae bacterium]|nr:reactive intermediate/imine deaminase [Flavobacteriaceae bacterium]|tara:strand:+ start:7025 stop:7408 length:384 start_codon:yes stop_codon:yes gene_type:complete
MNKKEIIYTNNAPSPIGPYNQAIKSKGILYLSGQIPLTPSMDLIENDIEKEVRQVMENLNEVLKAASMEFDNVVKATIYLNNMDDFSKVNSIYEEYFNNENAPARETVAVKTLPKNVRLEISMIAHE